MKPEDIARGYDRLASFWDGPQFSQDNGIQQHQRALQFVTDPPPTRGCALDIGCGSSGRFIDLLQTEGFNVEGLDLSTQMLELARQRHPMVTFYHADISAWAFPHTYQFITAWDCLWHLPLEVQKETLKKIMAGLARKGVFIFSMGGLHEPAEKQDNAMGPDMYYSTLGIPATLNVIADAGCLVRHLEFDQYPEPHVYLVAQCL